MRRKGVKSPGNLKEGEQNKKTKVGECKCAERAAKRHRTICGTVPGGRVGEGVSN